MKSGEYDYTKNGECTGCGRCCSDLLPLCDEEIAVIRKYIRRKKIEPCKHLPPTMYPKEDDTCPFRDDAKKICTIYEVRPMICREFKCDYPRKGIRLNGDVIDVTKYSLRRVRETFFGKSV